MASNEVVVLQSFVNEEPHEKAETAGRQNVENPDKFGLRTVDVNCCFDSGVRLHRDLILFHDWIDNGVRLHRDSSLLHLKD